MFRMKYRIGLLMRMETTSDQFYKAFSSRKHAGIEKENNLLLKAEEGFLFYLLLVLLTLSSWLPFCNSQPCSLLKNSELGLRANILPHWTWKYPHDCQVMYTFFLFSFFPQKTWTPLFYLISHQSLPVLSFNIWIYVISSLPSSLSLSPS